MSDAERSEIFERLVGECAERMATEGIAALADICKRYPEQAEALRKAMQPLLEFGVVDAEGDDGSAKI